MLQLDVQLLRRARAAELGVERATGASHATRDRAHRVRRSPRRMYNDKVSLANLAGKARPVLTILAAAAAGARGVCAPRAAAPAPSPRRLLRCSPQESCPTPRCSIFGSPWASPQVSLALRSAPGVAPWRRQQVGSGAAPRARMRGGDASAPPVPPPGRERSTKTTSRDMLSIALEFFSFLFSGKPGRAQCMCGD